MDNENYIKKEYSAYDDKYLDRELKRLSGKSKADYGTEDDTKKYFLILDIIKERSKLEYKAKGFSRFQTEVITASSAIVAFCAIVMLAIEGIRGL